MSLSVEQLLMAGVTSTRDLGGMALKASIFVRDRINKGEIPGATLYVSGSFIQKKPDPETEAFRWGINGVEEAKKKIKKLADAGVDCVKLIDQDQMTTAELKDVVETAQKYDLKVVANRYRSQEIRVGLQVNVDCLEYTGLSSVLRYPEDVMEAIKERTAQMNLSPLFWCPTVEGLYNYEYIRDKGEHLDNDS